MTLSIPIPSTKAMGPRSRGKRPADLRGKYIADGSVGSPSTVNRPTLTSPSEVGTTAMMILYARDGRSLRPSLFFV